MSQKIVEAHNRAIEALNRGDVEGMLEDLDPEVEWHPAMQAFFVGEPVYRGHGGVRALFRDFYAAFDEIHIEPSEVRDLGDQTVATGRIRSRGGESGAWVESSWGTLAEYRRARRFGFGPGWRLVLGMREEVDSVSPSPRTRGRTRPAFATAG